MATLFAQDDVLSVPQVEAGVTKIAPGYATKHQQVLELLSTYELANKYLRSRELPRSQAPDGTRPPPRFVMPWNADGTIGGRVGNGFNANFSSVSGGIFGTDEPTKPHQKPAGRR